ncbi:hypothetical protein [Endozoicomonas arenosclerae]|uniref:hypothetical protein n=1 Tax=Endozoicomonas arenosclerae TaxID=1633495 RepID=UPI000782F221|nr:hypothetical protein [Endozoicomonas arenosclerae]
MPSPGKRVNQQPVAFELRSFVDDADLSTSRSQAKTRTGRVVSASTRRRVLDEAFLGERMPQKNLRQRAAKKLKNGYLKAKVAVANTLIKAFTRLDDQLARLFRSEKVDSGLPRRFFPGYTLGDLIETRESFLGPLIAENTEDLSGFVFSKGIPEVELKHYNRPRLIVIRDGATNKYGHALLAFGDPTSGDDRYVQISSAHWYPEHLNSHQFSEYLQKWENNIAFEIDLKCKDEESMRNKLNELSQKKWLWGGPLHNCLTFCREVAEAGRCEEGIFSEFGTLSNRIPTSLEKGFHKGTAHVLGRAMEKHKLWSHELERLQIKLDDLCFEQFDETEDVFLKAETAEDLLGELLTSASSIIDAALLPGKFQKALKAALQSQVRKMANEELYKTNMMYLENENRLLADLPLATAYNMPVSSRIIGPQSHDGFHDGGGL